MLKKVAIALMFGLLFFPSTSLGDMSSANYRIYADSFNSGGVLSTSTSYGLEDTSGEPIASSTASASYIVRGGYQAMIKGILSLSISESTINLGTLNTATVISASTVATVSTNSDTGYTLSLGSVSGTSIAAVADGTVTAGVEEYGVAVSGSDAVFSNDHAVAGGLVLASYGADTVSRSTTVTFKAAISGGTVAGAYAQSAVLSASANL